jgi:hypothetical protein
MISKRFAALGNLSDSEDTNRTWENIEENLSIERVVLWELKQHKPWFAEEYLRF